MISYQPGLAPISREMAEATICIREDSFAAEIRLADLNKLSTSQIRRLLTIARRNDYDEANARSLETLDRWVCWRAECLDSLLKAAKAHRDAQYKPIPAEHPHTREKIHEVAEMKEHNHSLDMDVRQAAAEKARFDKFREWYADFKRTLP